MTLIINRISLLYFLMLLWC